MTASPRDFTIHRATPHEADIVSSILLEVAKWLFDRGIEMWPPAMLVPSANQRAIERGEVYLAYLAGEPVGTMRLQWEDQAFWPEMPPGDSLFIHRFAVRRYVAAQRVSLAMVEWAAGCAREAGRVYLRLDCEASRSSLRAAYVSLGFTLHSETQVGKFHVARYERRLW